MDGPRWPLDRQTGRWLVALATLGLACVAMPVGRPHAAPRQLDSTPRVEFARDILPIFEAKCTACHGPTLQESRLRLDSAEAIWRGGLAGHAVIPGDADASPLMRRLLGMDEPLMPFGGDPLPDEEVALVRRWIETAEFQFAASDALSGAAGTHWAYVPPSRPDLPVVRRTDWAHNAIDRFVLARLESEGFEPSPEAGKTTLIRRLSLDLIGLPPTIAELDDFLADARPDAYERLVDRLLASDRYGERWARPWLDLARYADTQGYEKDNPRSIWKYRDWVISALNADMSFRQFTIDQIAGDMLPESTLDQQIATGFHRNTLLNQEGGVDDEEARFDTLVDRVNTTATVWLGSTLGCAQCHNHKFDPFTQRDYYRFMAFFDNAEYEIVRLGQGESWVVEPTLALPTPEQEAQANRLESQIAALRTTLETPTPELEADRVAWEDAMRRVETQWHTLRPDRYSSAEGASLELLDDGSLLAGGDNPDADSYEIGSVAEPGLITGIRLEVLEDLSLPGGGPGRDPDGNFFLSRFEVEVASADASSAGGPVAFDSAVADDWQPGYEIHRALDATPEDGGWAIDATSPDALRIRQAVFVPDLPVRVGADARLTVRLRHDMPRAARNIGRFRLSVTSMDDPEAIVRVPARLRPVLDLPEADRTVEQARALAQVHRSVTPLLQPARDRVSALERELTDVGIASTLVIRERDSHGRPSTLFRNRGTFMSPGDRIHSAVPDALHPFPDDQMPNRLGLAHWLTDEENPLVARVTVNRFWEQVFGRGLVETAEDFGSQGSRPSHPKLLDWLAVEFMAQGTAQGAAQGWSMKALLRTIVTSATYRQSSAASDELLERDQYNVLFGRGPRFRVEAEMVRDIALATSGLLSHTIGGPSVFPYQPDGIWNRPYSDQQWIASGGDGRYRRGIYTYLRRTAPYPSLLTFDAPSRELAIVRRIRTNTPLQALTVLNDPVYFEAAQHLARRVVEEVDAGVAARIEHAFRLVLSRRPRADEIETVARFRASLLERFESDSAAARDVVGDMSAEGASVSDLAAWTMVSNVLLNLDETITKE